VRDEASFAAWLRDLLELGVGRNEAILLAHAYRAALARANDPLIAVNDLALALAPSQELRLETRQQGRSFLDAALAAWPLPLLEECAAAISDEVAYPIAVGITAAAHRVPLSATLHAFVFAFAQNMTSAAIRLAPIGQTAGARVLAALMPCIARIAREAETASLDAIGSSTFRADLGSFHHETQYTRLFRS
jgi:urease accessory protein